MAIYGLRYNETGRTTKVAFIPALVVVPAVFIIALFATQLGDWGLIAIGILTVLAGVITPIYVVLKMSPRVEVTVTEEGMELHFLNPGYFSPADYKINYSQLTNFYTDEYQGNLFCSFRTNGKPKQFNLSCRMPRRGVNLQQYEEFKDLVSVYISRYNEQANSAVIGSETLYEKGWAKFIAVMVVVFTIALAGLLLSGLNGSDFSVFRSAWVLILGWPFVIKVWQHNYGSKKRLV